VREAQRPENDGLEHDGSNDTFEQTSVFIMDRLHQAVAPRRPFKIHACPPDQYLPQDDDMLALHIAPWARLFLETNKWSPDRPAECRGSWTNDVHGGSGCDVLNP
jgi:hypothetical protein